MDRVHVPNHEAAIMDSASAQVAPGGIRFSVIAVHHLSNGFAAMVEDAFLAGLYRLPSPLHAYCGDA